MGVSCFSTLKPEEVLVSLTETGIPKERDGSEEGKKEVSHDVSHEAPDDAKNADPDHVEVKEEISYEAPDDAKNADPDHIEVKEEKVAAEYEPSENRKQTKDVEAKKDIEVEAGEPQKTIPEKNCEANENPTQTETEATKEDPKDAAAEGFETKVAPAGDSETKDDAKETHAENHKSREDAKSAEVEAFEPKESPAEEDKTKATEVKQPVEEGNKETKGECGWRVDLSATIDEHSPAHVLEKVHQCLRLKVTSVTDAVAALNSAEISCPEGRCVVHSASRSIDFLLWRSDKDEETRLEFALGSDAIAPKPSQFFGTIPEGEEHEVEADKKDEMLKADEGDSCLMDNGDEFRSIASISG